MLQAREMAPVGALPLPGASSSGDELFRMGLLYSTGQGGAPLDLVSAHMLFNLAAMRGSAEAKVYRRELSREMDPADVAEAQRQARQWLADGLPDSPRRPPLRCTERMKPLSTRFLDGDVAERLKAAVC